MLTIPQHLRKSPPVTELPTILSLPMTITSLHLKTQTFLSVRFMRNRRKKLIEFRRKFLPLHKKRKTTTYLSAIPEVQQYFSSYIDENGFNIMKSSEAMCNATAYTIACYKREYGWRFEGNEFWLRTSGSHQNTAASFANLSFTRNSYCYGNTNVCDSLYVRPALWIDLNS